MQVTEDELDAIEAALIDLGQHKRLDDMGITKDTISSVLKKVCRAREISTRKGVRIEAIV